MQETIRSLKFHTNYTKHAEGSVLVELGNTKVLCNASVIDGVPRFLRDKKPAVGWLTSEYGMLPRSTNTRMDREAIKGKQSGRTLEIQRLIGRSLRSCIDLTKIGPYTIVVDCDVIQADGGTRTAAISGGCVALVQALQKMQYERKLVADPMKFLVAAVSVGMYKNKPVLDLNYQQDSNADTDMNVVMTEDGNFIEIQGTAEQGSFSKEQLQSMLDLAEVGINSIIQQQKQVLSETIAG